MSRAFSQMRERHTERGGRTYRPNLTVLAFEVFDRMGLVLLQPVNPVYSSDDRRTMERLLEKSRRGKPTERPRTTTSATVEAAEAVFRTDTGDETQRASRGEIGGQRGG